MDCSARLPLMRNISVPLEEKSDFDLTLLAECAPYRLKPIRDIQMTPSDEELVEKVLAGQKDAFAGLIEKYKDAVYALAYSKLGNFEDAQDIAQESFLYAYSALWIIGGFCLMELFASNILGLFPHMTMRRKI